MAMQGLADLLTLPRNWLVTGAAGFIGSNLVRTLLRHSQRVRGLDNLSTGKRRNLDGIRAELGDQAFARFSFLEGDIRDLPTCRSACEGVDVVLHQAALGSVPRSIADPLATHDHNVTGFLTMLEAARSRGIRRFVYASSSSVYGDSARIPKVEREVGNPLSPYAASKQANEAYAGAYAAAYGITTVGLRYFNVFGPMQDPEGPYAAVIPRWLAALARGGRVIVYGDGLTTRDFCFVDNAVTANILAASVDLPIAGHICNIAGGAQVSLLELFQMLQAEVGRHVPSARDVSLEHEPFRPGDIRHSRADLTLANALINYSPQTSVEQGIPRTVAYYLQQQPAHDRG